MKVILTCILSIFFWGSQYAQQFRDLSDPTLPIKLLNVEEGNFLNDVPFIFREYEDSTLSLAPLKASLPKLAGFFPDSVKIVPPQKGWLVDLVYGMTFIYDEETGGGVLLLMLVGDALTPYPKFFVDRNLNLDFRDDGPPHLFKNANKKYKNFHLRSEKEKKVRIDFVLMNPVNHQSVLIIPSYISTPEDVEGGTFISGSNQHKEEVGEVAKDKGVIHTFGINGGIDFGMGKIRYLWPGTSYRVYYNPRRVVGGIFYQYKQFYIGFSASLESIYYQASFLESGSGFFSNPDFLPSNRHMYSIDFGYHLPLSETVHLMPFIHYSTVGFSDAQYTPRRDFPEEVFQVLDRSNFGPGMQFTFKISSHAALLFRGRWLGLDFSPSGYFEGITEEEPISTDKQLLLGLSYQYNF